MNPYSIGWPQESIDAKLLFTCLIAIFILTAVRLVRFFLLSYTDESESRFHERWEKGHYFVGAIHRSAILAFLLTATFGARRYVHFLINPTFPYSNEREPMILVMRFNEEILFARIFWGLAATLILYTTYSILRAQHERRRL